MISHFQCQKYINCSSKPLNVFKQKFCHCSPAAHAWEEAISKHCVYLDAEGVPVPKVLT